ncbi:MAG: hypothetical protein DI566_07750 [Microbacterium sp.]|nr:MAG: hypothetical protein DI566_07750 [Microbacterium sp.]
MFEVPFIRPILPPGHIIAGDVAEIVASNWFTNFGPHEKKFRVAIADRVRPGAEVVTFSNATLALIGVLKVFFEDARRDGLVIVPSFTFAAGPEAIRWAGLEPVFIDIEPVTVQPSLAGAASAFDRYGDRIVGILLCNTFGIGTTAIAEWESLAQEHQVPLIIDSAAGFGSVYPDGSPVGARGDCEVFSFHATKPFAIGEGGAAVLDDHECADRLRRFTNFGFGSDGAEHLGLNAKLQEFNAVIGMRQMVGFEEALQDRRASLERFRGLVEQSGLATSIPDAELSSVCFSSFVFADPKMRDLALQGLRSRGIEARVYYSPPVHLQPVFSESERVGTLAETESTHRRILALPSFVGMPDFAFHAFAAVLRELKDL